MLSAAQSKKDNLTVVYQILHWCTFTGTAVVLQVPRMPVSFEEHQHALQPPQPQGCVLKSRYLLRKKREFMHIKIHRLVRNHGSGVGVRRVYEGLNSDLRKTKFHLFQTHEHFYCLLWVCFYSGRCRTYEKSSPKSIIKVPCSNHTLFSSPVPKTV